jgi:NAD(P)-dependent dehydrogenase (short-subunit alcohol dehydrogenase family)
MFAQSVFADSADRRSAAWRPGPYGDRMRMRIAVLGATGNVGGEVARPAAERGHEVRAVARHRPATPVPGVEYVQADLGDAGSYEATSG